MNIINEIIIYFIDFLTGIDGGLINVKEIERNPELLYSRKWFTEGSILGSCLFTIRRKMKNPRIDGKEIIEHIKWFRENFEMENERFKRMLSHFRTTFTAYCERYNNRDDIKYVRDSYIDVTKLFFPEEFSIRFIEIIKKALQD